MVSILGNTGIRGEFPLGLTTTNNRRNKKTMKADIRSMGIMDMLAFVLCGKLGEGDGPKTKMKEGETPHGVIHSVTARRLHAGVMVMEGYIDEMATEHLRLHGESLDEDHDCEKFSNGFTRLRARLEILNKLMWQSVTEEYPQVASNNTGLREGWILVDTA